MSGKISAPVKVDKNERIITDPKIKAYRWRLNIPASVTGSKKIRKYRKTESQAINLKKQYEENSADISDKTKELLAMRGMTIEDAVQYALKHAPVIQNVKVEDLADSFLKNRFEEKHIGIRYGSTLRGYVKNIKTAFSGINASDWNKESILKFLNKLKARDGKTACSYASWNHHLETISAIFNHAVSENIVTQNPISSVSKKKKPQEHETAILSVADCEKLLIALQLPEHEEIRAAATLQLFSGARRKEVVYCAWENLNDNYLRLEKVKTCTNKRAVELEPCFFDWIKNISKKNGFIFTPKNFEEDRECNSVKDPQQKEKEIAAIAARLEDAYSSRLSDAAASAGIEIPKNATRHTAITMRLLKTQDLEGTALWAGNSPKVIQEDYRGIGIKEDAEKFYSLKPPATD
jgi:integrase